MMKKKKKVSMRLKTKDLDPTKFYPDQRLPLLSIFIAPYPTISIYCHYICIEVLSTLHSKLTIINPSYGFLLHGQILINACISSPPLN